MKKIIYIPADERPCNYSFPVLLSDDTDYELVVPPSSLMGEKKKPADVDGLWNFLLDNGENVEGAILSLDTLLYGGMIPSRLHNLTEEELQIRLSRLKNLRKLNPQIKIYAFQLIMRCPRYSSADEEPDYYEYYGENIFKIGFLSDKIELGTALQEEKEELKKIKKLVPEEVLKDYLYRREVNVVLNKKVLEYVEQGIIDFLVIPQDDSAPYGHTAKDQRKIRDEIIGRYLSLKVYMYPGADEVGMTLLARWINKDAGRLPQVYLRFSSIVGSFTIPLYEDRLLYESIKYQILAAGGIITSSMEEADFVLCVNSPGKTMREAVSQKLFPLADGVERNLVELIEFIDFTIKKKNKPCAVADIAYANGSDMLFIELLKQRELLFEVASYAGWNTSSNTLGTAIAQGMIYALYGKTPSHLNFLGLRYVEDAGYCAKVRQYMVDEKLSSLGLDYFHVDGKQGKAAEMVKKELDIFINKFLYSPKYNIVIKDCYMPWSRMFEIGLNISVQAKE
jgi:hypothetical protein